MTSTSSTPSEITGGCLCGSVRYKIAIPKDHDFSKATSTCQCSQCRRSTGSLYFHQHTFPWAAVSWPSSATLRLYHASPAAERAFCADCGCFLFWRGTATATAAGAGSERVSMAVGCFDPEVLHTWGRLLCEVTKHIWCEEEIKGVTDHLQGEKWRLDDEGEDAELMES